MIPFDEIDLSKPTVTTTVIDATTAESILSKYNWHNRDFKPVKLEGFTRDMSEGRWLFNGDAIRFGEDAGAVFLADGQNRLKAQVLTGTTQKWVIVTGLDVEAQETMDRNSVRSIGDAARLRGHPHAVLLVAVAKRAWVYYRSGIVAMGRNTPTAPEVLSFIEKHSENLYAATDFAYSLPRSFLVIKSAIGAAYYLCNDIDSSLATVFFSKLTRRTELVAGDPVVALLSRLENLRAANPTRRTVPPHEALRYLAVAWNHARKGRQVSRLQRPPDGWDVNDVKFQ